MGYVLLADHRSSVGLAAAVLCAVCLSLPTVLDGGEPPSPEKQAVLQVELRLPAGAAAGGRAAQAQVTVEPAGGARSPLRQTAPVPGGVSFEVAAGTAWQVRVEAPGYWSQPVPVVTPVLAPGAPPAPARAVVDLLPAGRVAGELRPPAGHRLPAELSVRLRSAPGVRPVLEEAQLTCPVTAEGRFECAVPAGQLDLRLRARGFLTHSYWGVKVPAGGAFAAGPLPLRPGASVVGWIAPPGPDFRYQDCTANLEPYRVGTPPSLADAERAPALGQSARVNSRGYFEITGVAPGGYRLVVRHPRWAPAEVAPLNVLDGAETEIHSIALRPQADLEVRLEPARSPGGGRWKVTLLREGTDPGHLVTVRQGSAAADGIWRAPGLAPGDYQVEVSGEHQSRWAFEDFSVEPDMAPRVVRLPLVEVEGEVTLGDEPVSAVVWFGGRFGAVRIPASADADGRFTVTLPEQEGAWRVEVFNREQRVHAVLPEVEVRKAPGQPVARVELQLPDTRVRGLVVDESGRPVGGAQVSASHAGGLAQDESGDDGRFELRGLAPGEWKLEATASTAGGDLHAEVVRLLLAEDQPVDDVRLVLRPRLQLTGQVVGPSGQGLPGVQVVGVLDQSQRLLEVFLPEATTDVTGTFTLKLPTGAEGVRLHVLAPGFALRQLRLDARSREPLIVPVHQVGGTVAITYAGGEEIPAPLKQLATSLFREFEVPPTVLQEWARLHRVPADADRYVVPMLEPGPYVVCYDVYGLVYRSGRLPEELAGRCTRGELTPGGRLELRLAVPKDGGAAEP